MLAVLLGAAAAFFALLDGWHVLRMALAALRPGPRAGLLQEHRLESRVLPADLDPLLHMSNARYPREADVARCAHLAGCGLLGAARALGARLVLAASCCRYRRPLRLPERFAVRSRLLGWDARAFVAEQRFVRARDGFVCAVLLARLHVEGATPGRLVARLCGRQVESPELPEEVQHWMKYNEASSRKLRAESGLQPESESQ